MLVSRRSLVRSSLEVAPYLLGHVIRHESGAGAVSVRITETEAYLGAEDPGSHAFRGPTARNAPMFGPAGHAYVYFTYGMHWCCNVVCGAQGVALAALLRAGEVIEGIDLARSRRPAAKRDRDLGRGPANLARALGIDGSLSGTDLLGGGSLTLLRGKAVPPDRVVCGVRVGLSAGADLAYRFAIADDPTVSRPKVLPTPPATSIRTVPNVEFGISRVAQRHRTQRSAPDGDGSTPRYRRLSEGTGAGMVDLRTHAAQCLA